MGGRTQGRKEGRREGGKEGGREGGRDLPCIVDLAGSPLLLDFGEGSRKRVGLAGGRGGGEGGREECKMKRRRRSTNI